MKRQNCTVSNTNKNDNNKKPKTDKPKKDTSSDTEDDEMKIFFRFMFPDNNNNNNNTSNNNNKPKLIKRKTPDEPECRNPRCNHKSFKEDPLSVAKSCITEIKNINDIIDIGKTYHCKKNKEYCGLNLRIMNNLVMPLTELNNMIGLESVKSQIINQILFFLRGYNKNTKCNNCVDCTYELPCAKNIDDMLHTVITGPPGVGKTQMGKILAKIYKEMGVLSKGHFKLVTRSDLIGKYLGHTAVKTQEMIDECEGGVMFIDEAYALGHSEGRDSFSKECIDTLNQNLSEKRDFLCIIAGYKDALEDCFFSMNDGLRRRFTFRYDIEKYNGSELMEIFILKVQNGCWQYKEQDTEQNSELLEFFNDNKGNFPNYGGDIETLFLNCKIAHCRKIELSNNIANKILSLDDIKEGFKMFASSRKNTDDDIPSYYT